MADPIIGKISVGDGATFTPHVSADGILTFTNNKNLPNPDPVNIVQAVVDSGGLAPIASPAFTGAPTAPTPTAGDDSTKIATTEFVNDKADNYLPLDGGTLTGELYSKRINNQFNFAKGTVPSATQYAAMYFSDNAGNGYGTNCIGLVESKVTNANVSSVYIRAVKNEANSTVNCEISCNVDANGHAYTSAPTPADSDDSTQIATTAWARNVFLPLSGGTMTGNIRSSSNEMFVLRKNDNLHGIQLWSGSSYNDGASISLYGKGYSQSGVFNIGAYGENASCLLHGEPNGTLTWNGAGLGGTYLGPAISNIATDLTLPKTGTYLVITGHNSSAGLNSIFIVRTGANNAFKMAGGANITMTCSGTTISVTPTNGTVTVHYIYLG